MPQFVSLKLDDVHTKLLRSSSTYQLYVSKTNLAIFHHTFVFTSGS